MLCKTGFLNASRVFILETTVIHALATIRIILGQILEGRIILSCHNIFVIVGKPGTVVIFKFQD